MAELTDIRARIDSIDSQMLALFRERMACADEVAAYKREHNKPVIDRARERAKLAEVADSTPEDLRDAAVVLFNLLMELSSASQAYTLNEHTPVGDDMLAAIENTPALFPQSAFVACQGVEGAFSQIACDKLFKRANISYFSSFEAVFRAVDQGLCSYGVLPLENSTAGTVNQVYDLMQQYDFHIARTVRVKVVHNLLAKPGVKLDRITDIYSHPQAIEQCSAFLESLPNVTVHAVDNTAAAAKAVAASESDTVAALGSRTCATLYDLDVVRASVQDNNDNYTRFACISKNLEIYPGANRTTLLVTVANEPGSLYKVLARFYSLDINLIKLESRPIPGRDFEFLFYFDIECDVAAPEFQRLMNTLADVCEDFRYLGSYTEAV
jgi:chorismate mutase/prephenate dehydratase